MKLGTSWKVMIVLALIVAVVTVLSWKSSATAPADGAAPAPPLPAPAAASPAPGASPADSTTGLPRLVNLGAKLCIPCKMMEPIREELSREYQGKLQVEFIDVHERPDEARQWGVQVIPTQVFLDASGQELERNLGFIPKEDILAIFSRHGVDLSAATAPPGDG